MANKLEIRKMPHTTEIYLDGHEIRDVTSFSLRSDNETTYLDISVIVADSNVNIYYGAQGTEQKI